jgi:predicted DNA-binding transcriptional regulator AlpA
MHEVLEQVKQEQEKKRRRLEQLKRPNRGQRARRCSKRAPEKPSQERKDADEEPPAKPPLVFLSKQQVLARIPITGPTLWNWSRTGKFPAPRYIGSRTVWVAAEVDEWMRTRPKRTYKTGGA